MSVLDLAPVKALLPEDLSLAHRLRLVACALISVSMIVKAWVLLPGWFYSDDFIFLDDALNHPLSADFLLTPHDSQLMPVGVAISWVVAHAGAYNWLLAASITIALQLAAALACFVMLRTLFGDRWAVLVPLTFYLFTAMSLEAVSWWAAALNAVPIHIAFFLLVTCVTRWARERTWPWALGSGLSLLLAAASGPRGLVMLVPVGLLVLCFLTPGTWWSRPWRAVRLHAALIVPLIVVGAGYLAVYASTTPSPVEAQGSAPAGPIAKNLLATSWLTSLVGGPWRWTEYNPPMSRPDPPVVLYVLATIAVLALVVTAFRRGRSATLAALLVMAAQLTVTYLAIVFGRGLQLGAGAGLMTRYLNDTLIVTTLVMGLLLMPVVGGQLASRPARATGRRQVAVGGMAAVFVVGSLVSTLDYASAWHRDYPARAFVENARSSLGAEPTVIAQIEVPNIVQSRLSYPNNLPARLLAPLGRTVDARYHGNDLQVLDDDGVARQASVFASTDAAPGPDAGCGHRVADRPASITLRKEVPNPFWWMTVGYLASADGTVDVRVDGARLGTMDVEAGLHTYFVRGEGPFRTVGLASRTDDLTVCVDSVRVGDLVPVS